MVVCGDLKFLIVGFYELIFFLWFLFIFKNKIDILYIWKERKSKRYIFLFKIDGG